MNLPLEIINKIFTYASSRDVDIIRGSRFYHTEHPFFYLKHVSYCDVQNMDLQDDIISINRKIYNDRVSFRRHLRILLCEDDLDILETYHILSNLRTRNSLEW